MSSRKNSRKASLCVACEVYHQVLGTFGGRRRYLLGVVGQSMTGAGIEDGDLLVVEEREDPPDRSVVVALIGDGDHRNIVLPADEVRLQGEVVFVIHPPRR